MNTPNQVDLDPVALAREADAALASAPKDALPPNSGAGPGEAGAPGESEGEGSPADAYAAELARAEAEAKTYEIGARIVVGKVVDLIAPNWHITDEEKLELAKTTSLALALWFPGMIVPPKYAALLGIGMVAYAIADARRDENGNYPPRKVMKKAETAGAPPPASAPAAPIAANGNGFSTAS